MTAATIDRPTAVTQTRVLRSEWTKLISLRSTAWTLLVAVALTIGLGALFAAVTNSQWDTFSAEDKATFDAIGTSLSGITFSQLAIGVLGVLLVAGEYSTGMIRASLTAVPARLPVLWGKLAVFGGVVFVVSLLSALGAFLLGQPLLGDLGVSLSSGGASSSLLGAAAYLTLAGLMAVALGSLLRTTAAGISTFVGVFFLLPPLTQLLPSSWADNVVQYLPSNAGSALYGATMGIDNPLSTGAALAVLCAYTAVLIAAAAWRLRSTDA